MHRLTGPETPTWANAAAEDADLAGAQRATRVIDPTLAILAISGTVIERVARDAGTPVYSGIFADRSDTPAGTLLPRNLPGALLTDAGAAADRLLAFLESAPDARRRR